LSCGSSQRVQSDLPGDAGQGEGDGGEAEHAEMINDAGWLVLSGNAVSAVIRDKW